VLSTTRASFNPRLPASTHSSFQRVQLTMSKKGSKSAAKEVSSYETRDVVLGKVRGFPPWPGMVRRRVYRIISRKINLNSECFLLLNLSRRWLIRSLFLRVLQRSVRPVKRLHFIAFSFSPLAISTQHSLFLHSSTGMLTLVLSRFIV